MSFPLKCHLTDSCREFQSSQILRIYQAPLMSYLNAQGLMKTVIRAERRVLSVCR